MSPKQAPPEFIQKVKDRMVTENIGIRDLAKKTRVSHPTITELVTYGKTPSFNTAVALAKWMKQSEVATLREAGLLPPGPENEIKFEDWKFLLDQLTPEEEQEMREIAIRKIERHKTSNSLKSLKPKKVGK